MLFPVGTYGRLTSRSSTSKKLKGLAAVEEGVIDAGYTGELIIRLRTIAPTDTVTIVRRAIAEGWSFAQIIPQMVLRNPPIEVVKEMPEIGGRGAAGFGSTDSIEPFVVHPIYRGPSEPLPKGPEVRGHVLLTKATCPCHEGDRSCPVCDDGLSVCAKCDSAEIQLDKSCTK